jgi:D-xylose transport system ATP-binding protein
VSTTSQEQIISSITGAVDNTADHRSTDPEETWP